MPKFNFKSEQVISAPSLTEAKNKLRNNSLNFAIDANFQSDTISIETANVLIPSTITRIVRRDFNNDIIESVITNQLDDESISEEIITNRKNKLNNGLIHMNDSDIELFQEHIEFLLSDYTPEEIEKIKSKIRTLPF